MLATDGQISMEFMGYFGFLLLIFTIFAPIFFEQAARINRVEENLEATRIANIMEREINMAVRFGDGYSRNFTLPEKIDGQNYNLSVNKNTRLLEIEWSDERMSRQILTNNSKGQPSMGENLIKNFGGKIIFG